jgi:hypothetical protein
MSSIKIRTHSISETTVGSEKEVHHNDLGNNTLVKVILLANGIGCNPQSYRPNADESQWWNRRDALVRCVTAFFFCSVRRRSNGISNQSDVYQNGDCSRKELIILFDQDWSYFSMMYNSPSSSSSSSSTRTDSNRNKGIPSESNIMQLWKSSALNPGIRIRCNDLALSCLCVTDPNMANDCMESMVMSNMTSMNNTLKRLSYSTATMTSMDSDGFDSTNKRSILEYLQSTCSMEFLRRHKYDKNIAPFCSYSRTNNIALKHIRLSLFLNNLYNLG